MHRRDLLELLVGAAALGTLSPAALAATQREWNPATLVAAERHDDAPEMERKQSTTTSTDILGDDHTTSTTTVAPSGLQKLWMYYTIQSAKTVYVVRIGVNFPWTKRINAEAGSPVQYAVDGKKLYVLNEDGTEDKCEIMSTRMAALAGAPPAATHP